MEHRQAQAFEREHQEAFDRLREKNRLKPLLSPITGEPMEQVVLHGVVVDRCPTSGGIWLDAGEIEQLVRMVHEEEHQGEPENALTRFFKGLAGV